MRIIWDVWRKKSYLRTIFERERKKLYLHMQFDSLWQKAACTLPYAERTKESFLLCLSSVWSSSFENTKIQGMKYLVLTYVEVESFTNEMVQDSVIHTHGFLKTYMNYSFAIFFCEKIYTYICVFHNVSILGCLVN